MCGGVFAAVLYEIGFRPTRYPVSAFSDLHDADSMHAGGEMLIRAQQGTRKRDLFSSAFISWNTGVVHHPLFWGIKSCSIMSCRHMLFRPWPRAGRCRPAPMHTCPASLAAEVSQQNADSLGPAASGRRSGFL